MRRVTCSELLDEDRGTARDIEDSLDDLWRINRWLGGVSSSLRLLRRFFARTGVHPVRILDVGAGDSRLAGRLQLKLRKRGVEAEFTVLDRQLTHLQNGRQLPLCRQDGGATSAVPQAVVADVLALPFADGSFNVVMLQFVFPPFFGPTGRATFVAAGGDCERGGGD